MTGLLKNKKSKIHLLEVYPLIKNMLSELLNLKCFKKVLAGRMLHEPTFKKLTDITIEISVVKVMLSVCRVFINKPCLQCMFFSILMKNYFILTGL